MNNACSLIEQALLYLPFNQLFLFIGFLLSLLAFKANNCQLFRAEI